MSVWVVVDLGFGDAGKGSVTDFLVRDRGADLVVRFNGGAQAGHNVVAPDGRHHTFSQFGAGLLAGTPGLLGPAFLLHPLAMWVEAEHLEQLGIADPWAATEVAREARVITPYHQEAGRIRELLRGDRAHGTCGVGIGACVQDGLEHPEDALCAGDLRDGPRLRRHLERQRSRLRAELVGLGASELGLFDDAGLVERVLTAWGDIGAHLRLLDRAAVEVRIRDAVGVVFEGAQGVLLDQDWGFHPHTTWSDCTPAGARALLGDRPATVLGVLRSYGVRHGLGPFPTEGGPERPEPHNDGEGWQGHFRTGALDGVLLRYALHVCGGVDGIALTCLDRVSEGAICDAYGDLRHLEPGPREELAHRERLGARLRQVEPVLQHRDVASYVAQVAPVWLESRGPRAGDKRWSRR